MQYGKHINKDIILATAYENRHTIIIDFLLDKGVKADGLILKYSNSIAHFLNDGFNNTKITYKLLKNVLTNNRPPGYTINDKYNGESAFDTAVRSYDDSIIIRYLLYEGGIPSKDILHVALKTKLFINDYRLLEHIIDTYKININEKDKHQDTPLYVALNNFDITPQVIRILIGKGANPHIEIDSKLTILQNYEGLARMNSEILDILRSSSAPKTLSKYMKHNDKYMLYDENESSHPNFDKNYKCLYRKYKQKYLKLKGN